MESQIGYIRKVNTKTGLLLDLYSYTELLLFRSLRSQLKLEMLEDRNIHLYCACSNEDNRPVYLNDACSIYFPSDCGHNRYCASYLSTLSDYLRIPAISMIINENNCLDVAFRWRKGCHTKTGVVRSLCINALDCRSPSLSLEDFVQLINLRVSHKICLDIFHKKRNRYPDSSEMLFEIAYELGKYTLQDPEGHTFSLKEQNFFKDKAMPGSISFLYARALTIERGYKSNVYITAQHINGKSSFLLSHEKWNSLEPCLQLNLPLYICGFVRTTEVNAFTRGKRDSVTHAFQTSRPTQKRVHELTSFCLFHTSLNGMLCATQDDFDNYNRLCNAGVYFCIPYFPEISCP